MNFEEAMSLVELDCQFPEDPKEFHNERTRALFQQTGLDLELAQIPLVVVAGSCGKCSTARYLAEIVSEMYRLTGSEKQVGLGTKPPLFESLDGNRERYQLVRNGRSEWISKREFARLVNLLIAKGADVPRGLAPYDLRYWLLGQMFVENQVGLGIVEANIGLRKDPANIFPAPIANLITPVCFDHLALLRPTDAPQSVLNLGQRAGPYWHKVSSVPEDRLLISGTQEPEVAQLMSKRAGPLLLAGRDFDVRVETLSLEGTKAQWHHDGQRVDIELKTLGRHQAENASQAAATFWKLREMGVFSCSEALAVKSIQTGIARTQIPGRLERLSEDPHVLLNAATGIVKIEAMMETLEETLKQGQRAWVCFSALRRLFKESQIPEWLDVSLRRILCSNSLAGLTTTAFVDDLPAQTLGAWAKERAGEKPVEIVADPREALAMAQHRADLVLLSGQSQAELRNFFDIHPSQ